MKTERVKRGKKGAPTSLSVDSTRPPTRKTFCATRGRKKNRGTLPVKGIPHWVLDEEQAPCTLAKEEKGTLSSLIERKKNGKKRYLTSAKPWRFRCKEVANILIRSTEKKAEAPLEKRRSSAARNTTIRCVIARLLACLDTSPSEEPDIPAANRRRGEK